MSDRASFLARRQTGIGGSDVGAIVGLNPHRNALGVYLEKVGEIKDAPPTDVMVRGRELEPLIRARYYRETGRRSKQARFRRHKRHRWLIGHPDSLVRAVDLSVDEPGHEIFDQGGVLECKSMNYHVLQTTVERGLSESYQLQGQHYCLLCGHQWVAFALLHPDSWRFAVVNQEADPSVQKRLVEICEHFWFEHVVPQKPPKPVEPEWTVELPAVEGLVVDRHDDAWRAAVGAEQDLKGLLAEASALYEQSRDDLKALCGRHGVFEGAGARVYFKQRAGARHLGRQVIEAAGLVDPLKLAAWAVEVEADYPGLLALLQADAKGMRADLDGLLVQGKPYEDLRIFHTLED